MPRNLTKKDIEFDSAYLYKETDPTTGDVTLRVNVGYTITTDEGETIKRDLNGQELTGGDKARANNMFNSLIAEIKTQEGI